MKNLICIIALLFIFSCGTSSTEASNATDNTQSKIEETTEVANVNVSTDQVKELPPIAVKNDIEKVETKIKKEVAEVKKETSVLKTDQSKETSKPIEPKQKEVTVPKKESVNNTAVTDVIKTAPVVEKPKAIVKENLPPKKVEPPVEIKKPEPIPVPATPQKITSLTHQAFDDILKKYVSASGNVNYKSLKNETSKLNVYLSEIEKIKVSDLSGRNEKMAFWINAYNAYTLKLILKNYPLSKITDLNGGKPWDVKWIKLDGKTLSLNNIENDILRPVYKDARIHFAVNCAAKSCPPLLNKAWTAKNLESNFQTQTKKFVNDPNFNKISKKKVEISKIFEWYGEDFGNLVDFLNKYSLTKINSNAKINFVDYNWSLNQ